MSIIYDRALLQTATKRDLVDTFNALTDGPKIKGLESRAVGIRRCDMLLMAAVDKAGHAGVPKGEMPQVQKVEVAKPEKTAKSNEAANKSKPTEEKPVVATKPKKVNAARKPFAKNSLAAKLETIAEKQKPIEPKEKDMKKKTKPGRKGLILTAKKMTEGTTKMHEGSIRRSVWNALKGNPITALKLAENLDMDVKMVRGHLTKLQETGWAELKHAE